MHISDMAHQDTITLHPRDIPVMEANLAANGATVAELCRRASIAQTTWGRWKNGTVLPGFRAWDAASAAYKSLVSEDAPK